MKLRTPRSVRLIAALLVAPVALTPSIVTHARANFLEPDSLQTNALGSTAQPVTACRSDMLPGRTLAEKTAIL